MITLLSAMISGVLTESNPTEEGAAEVSELVQARSCQEFLNSKPFQLLIYIRIANL